MLTCVPKMYQSSFSELLNIYVNFRFLSLLSFRNKCDLKRGELFINLFVAFSHWIDRHVISKFILLFFSRCNEPYFHSYCTYFNVFFNLSQSIQISFPPSLSMSLYLSFKLSFSITVNLILFIFRKINCYGWKSISIAHIPMFISTSTTSLCVCMYVCVT